MRRLEDKKGGRRLFCHRQKEQTTAHMAQEDPKGERGGDTGETKQVGHGQHAEKGDARREKIGDRGPTHSSDDARAQGEKTRTAGG
jgi:hypothetical protein